jgi:2'-5' RNA ligase
VALAVCLLLDGRSERLVRRLWTRLEEIGVDSMASHTHGSHHPHLSYAVLRSWDHDAVTQAVSALPDGGAVELSCQGALVFPRGRVALAPAVDAEVTRRQQAVVGAVESSGADLHRHYAPGSWVPHVSVATRAAAPRLAATVTAIADVLPLRLVADRAALIDSSTGELWSLPVVP